MDSVELKRARESYNYIPARLVRSEVGAVSDLNWNDLALSADLPNEWRSSASLRAQFSSLGVDEFHNALLNSDDDEDLMHGLLSVVFWGYASGTDGRVNSQRALSKSRMILEGRTNSLKQDTEEIIFRLKAGRDFMRESRIADALLEISEIKFLRISFASKVLTFMRPTSAAVYDEVIDLRLAQQPDPQMRELYIGTKAATGVLSKRRQADIYEKWCRWCSSKADSLNLTGSIWKDWNGSENVWRAVDVERGFFALGRSIE